MNLGNLGGQLGAFWHAHQKPILIAGAGGVVVLGLHARNTSAAADAASTDLGTTSVAAQGANLAGYDPTTGASTGAYDSTGTDVYNALQPQLEQTQGDLSQTNTLLGNLSDGVSSLLTSVRSATASANKAAKAANSAGHKPAKKPAKKPHHAPAGGHHAAAGHPTTRHPATQQHPAKKHPAGKHPAVKKAPARQAPKPAPRQVKPHAQNKAKARPR